jgi:acyl-CoA synthetase (AMP-forming)/AMP-acid ligase II
LAADADNIVAAMGLRPEWPNLGVISMAHSYGFSNLVLPLLLHGIPLILLPSPLPEIVRSAAAFGRDLTLAAVPAMWGAWHAAGTIPGNVRLAISAGAPLRADLERAVFEASGIKIHNFYGSSECGGIAYDSAAIPRVDESFVGFRMQAVALSLNSDGCLSVASRAVGETYWPEAEESLGNGLFQTNDIAKLQGDKVFLRGRSSDRINIAGRKVAPDAIEQALREHPSVAECLIFGVPNPIADRADLIVACVESRGKENPDELRRFLLAAIPGWQVPREWWFVDSLSANQRGKISRAAWRARYLERVR